MLLYHFMMSESYDSVMLFFSSIVCAIFLVYFIIHVISHAFPSYCFCSEETITFNKDYMWKNSLFFVFTDFFLVAGFSFIVLNFHLVLYYFCLKRFL